MKDIIENIKKDMYSKKIVILVVIIIVLLGIIFGSIYITVIDNNSKKNIIHTVNNYYISFKSINIPSKLDIFKSSFFKNIIYYLVMWLLGLSIIGLPIIGIMVFFKSFIVGFNIASIFACYKFKGIIFILVYLIPNIITLILSILLGIYSINLSIKLSSNILGKKTLNFGAFMGKYFFILLNIILILALVSLYEAFISPSLIKIFINSIK